ncbi:MAG: hypothetical protein R8G34_04295 [Paracoccaceae bacterium]|nr:hypothetical protein [Paracoccaceae bacterium]
MKKFNDAKELVAGLSDQLSEERLAEVRSVTGIGHLPPGSLTELVADEAFSVEDIVTMLLSGWILQQEEIRLSAEKVSQLEDQARQQSLAFDEIADQATRLRVLLSSVLPDRAPVSSVELLKQIAASAGHRKAEDF